LRLENGVLQVIFALAQEAQMGMKNSAATVEKALGSRFCLGKHEKNAQTFINEAARLILFPDCGSAVHWREWSI
jgi:hypothetical protein